MLASARLVACLLARYCYSTTAASRHLVLDAGAFGEPLETLVHAVTVRRHADKLAIGGLVLPTLVPPFRALQTRTTRTPGRLLTTYACRDCPAQAPRPPGGRFLALLRERRLR